MTQSAARKLQASTTLTGNTLASSAIPARTVVKVSTAITAEADAPCRGFSKPRIHPIQRGQVQRAKWLAIRRLGHLQKLGNGQSLRIRI